MFTPKFGHIIDGLAVKGYQKSNHLFSNARFPFSSIPEMIREINPDIVHLHWITGGMMSVEDIGRIRKPIIWSLHDMWPFTGGCHYDNYCAQYKQNCGACPILNSNRNKDLSYFNINRRLKTLSKVDNLTIVGLSKWLADCASSSRVFSNRTVVNLPNPIDTKIYSKVEKVQARRILGLSENKKIVLFGGYNAVANPLKGYQELMAALKLIETEDFEIIVFGSPKMDTLIETKLPVHFLGSFSDDIALKIIYNSADVIIQPSKQENLSNIIMESLACGTPVVAFNIGGNPDLIEHKINGYLAAPFEPRDLARGIDWVLNHQNPNNISESALDKVKLTFEMNLVAQKYIALYKSVLK